MFTHISPMQVFSRHIERIEFAYRIHLKQKNIEPPNIIEENPYDWLDQGRWVLDWGVFTHNLLIQHLKH